MDGQGPALPLQKKSLDSVNTRARHFSLFAAHARRGQLDRFVDFDVARTAAEVPAQSLFDLVARRLGVLRQKLFGNEEEAGRAVAALGRARVGEGLLQRVQALFRQHPLDRLDATALGFEAEHEAGEHASSVNQHGAGTALAQLAAVFRAREIQVFTQDFEQRLVRREGDLRGLAVQREFDVGLLPGYLRLLPIPKWI